MAKICVKFCGISLTFGQVWNGFFFEGSEPENFLYSRNLGSCGSLSLSFFKCDSHSNPLIKSKLPFIKYLYARHYEEDAACIISFNSPNKEWR